MRVSICRDALMKSLERKAVSTLEGLEVLQPVTGQQSSIVD